MKSSYAHYVLLSLLFLALLRSATSAIAQQNTAAPTTSGASPVISVETQDGQIVCNSGGASSQIPGHNDLFVNAGFGPGTIDDCHNPPPGGLSSFIGLFRMDWANHKMVLVKYLFRPQKPPAKEPTGVWSAYDVYVASYNGTVWVAFECDVPGSTSSCIAPLTPNFDLDLSRLTVVAKGYGNKSASTPVLLNFRNHFYMYWSLDFYQHHELPENKMVTRGMQLEEDSDGRVWGEGSGGRPVATDDPGLTTLVDDVRTSDPTADHVAQLRYVTAFGSKLLVITTVGGTAGQQVCVSAHQISPGCFRMSLSVADAPLGDNVFGKKIVNVASLPNNVINYPRLFTDPSGHNILMGIFDPPKVPDPVNKNPPIPHGMRTIPFDAVIAETLKAQ